MTTDNFAYFSDEEFSWTGILNFYTTPKFDNKKGTRLTVQVRLDKEINLEDIATLEMMGNTWTWGEDRRIKAFKLIDQSISGENIYYQFETIRKSKRYDEIKYFLFDLGAYLCLSKYKIVGILVEEKKL